MKKKPLLLLKLVVLLWLGLMVAGSGFASDNEDEAVRLLQEGTKLYKARQYQQAQPLFEKALKLCKEILGAKDPATLTITNTLAELYASQSHYKQAQPLYEETLKLRAEVLGVKHPDTLTSMSNLATLYYMQGHYVQAQQLFEKNLTLDKEVLGTKHPATINIMINLAMMFKVQGHYEKAQPLLEESLTLHKKILGAKHPDTLTSMNNLALLYKSQGHYEQAQPLYEEALKLRKEVLGANHPDTLVSMINLASLYSEQGHYNQALPFLVEALKLYKEVLGTKNPDTLKCMNALSVLYHAQGHYEQAQPLSEETLKLYKEVLGAKHPDTLASMDNLALLYRSQGHYEQSQRLSEESLKLYNEVLGAKHPDTLTSMSNLAVLYHTLGHYEQAQPLLEKALNLHKKLFGAKHPATLTSMSNLATLYYMQGHFVQAQPLLDESLKLHNEVLGAKHPATLTSMTNLATLYYMQGHFVRAKPLYEVTFNLHKEIFGAKHPATLDSMTNLAVLYTAQGKYEQALSYISSVNENYTNILPSLIDDKANTGLISQTNKNNFILQVNLTNHLQKNGTNLDLTSEAFKVAQMAHNSVDAQIVTQMALAYAADDPETKNQIEKLRDVVAYRSKLNVQLIAALSGKDTENPSSIQVKIEKNEATIKQLDSQLKNTFPAYSQIIRPTPIPLADIQQTLAKDEALLVYLLAEKESYVLVVKHDKALLRRLSVGKDSWQQQVDSLRQAFYRKCEKNENCKFPEPPAPRPTPEAFDIQLAHRLYQQLLAPIEAELTDTKHLLTVADGALHSLPFQLLVKTAPAKMGKFSLMRGGYKQVDWLVKHFAFSSLPSVKSLAVLRDKNKTAATAKQPFIGFGDPAFRGKPGGSKGLTVESLFRGDGGGIKTYLIDLPRLKDTANEIKNLASSLDYFYRYLPEFICQAAEGLGLISKAVYLQNLASESEVKHLSKSGQLDTRVLAFSTHGLLAHETVGMKGIPTEAGLALPEKNAGDQDGLLTGSEISQLNLNADWIVLSACNTATLEKNSEASGLSELAKAFFLKGTRSLLASHWYVNSATTEYLLTQTFARLEKDPQLPRSEALRQSMLSLIDATEGQFSNGRYAHPLYWAPFVIMGEGGV